MNRVIIGAFLLFISFAAAAAEVPSEVARGPIAAEQAVSAVAAAEVGTLLNALMAGLTPGSCATRTSAPADIPILLAQPLEGAVATSSADVHEIFPNFCCSCGGSICCPQKGTCISCGGLPCVCCNP